MKKPVFPRIAGLLALYAGMFFILAMVQFSKQGNFTYRVGNLVVSGRYRKEDTPPSNPREYALAGKASVFFGGVEFRLADDSGGEGTELAGEDQEALIPEYMLVSDESVLFRLSGGTELRFATLYSGGVPELRIDGNFSEGAVALHLPYRPLRTSRVISEGGQFIINAGGVSYSFGRSPLDGERQLLILDPEGTPVSYRAIPDRKAFAAADYTIPQARDREQYEASLSRWRDQSFSLWNRTISSSATEDLVAAYAGESILRGGYKAAVSAVPASFLTGGQRSFESSVYLGRLDQALRSLSAYEREKSARLSRIFNEKSLDFLKEPHVIAYLGIRGYGNLMDDGAEMILAQDPAALSLDLAAGILEGWQDWSLYRPRAENPFDRLIDQACFVISREIRINARGDRIFVFQGEEANCEYSLRLGKALMVYGETGHEDWAALGRSLILSVLSLADETGLLPGRVILSEEKEFRKSGDTQLNSAALYRMLQPGDYYPRALSVGAPSNGIWTWTAASAVSVSGQENSILDISVSFPVGETHYMLIRGIKPFTKIQLYNMDFRTDPQFERYDSSGWAYSASEQTLLLKMKHRASVEHIVIYY